MCLSHPLPATALLPTAPPTYGPNGTAPKLCMGRMEMMHSIPTPCPVLGQPGYMPSCSEIAMLSCYPSKQTWVRRKSRLLRSGLLPRGERGATEQRMGGYSWGEAKSLWGCSNSQYIHAARVAHASVLYSPQLQNWSTARLRLTWSDRTRLGPAWIPASSLWLMARGEKEHTELLPP